MAAKRPPRKRIPPEVEKRVLTQSRRRCVLCFHLDRDTKQKHGQIAHLDRRRSNSDEDNLAFLCLKHHSEYDSTTSQHKNYTIDEVKAARRALCRWVKKGMPPLAFRSGRTIENRRAASRAKNSTRSMMKKDVPGPEIVIDYAYAEDSKDHDDSDAPLVIRNASPTYPAYNVEVLPLETDQGAAPFEPALIPYIEPGGTRKVSTNISGGSHLFRKRLPNFLFKSYKDTSHDELFGTKTFALRVRYKGTGSTVFETECELLFRPWKKETKTGRINRRVATTSGPHLRGKDQDPNRPVLRLEFANPKLNTVGHREHGFLVLHNVGGRAASNVDVQEIRAEDWRVEFERIGFIKANDKAILVHRTYHGDSFFAGSSHSSPAHGLRTFLNTTSPITDAQVPLRITYEDTDGTGQCVLQVIHYEPMLDEVSHVSTESCPEPVRPPHKAETVPSKQIQATVPILKHIGVGNIKSVHTLEDQPFGGKTLTLFAVTISNSQMAAMRVARNVKVELDYVHQDDRFSIQEGAWSIPTTAGVYCFEDRLDLESGESGAIVLAAQYSLGDAEYQAWSVRAASGALVPSQKFTFGDWAVNGSVTMDHGVGIAFAALFSIDKNGNLHSLSSSGE